MRRCEDVLILSNVLYCTRWLESIHIRHIEADFAVSARNVEREHVIAELAWQGATSQPLHTASLRKDRFGL